MRPTAFQSRSPLATTDDALPRLTDVLPAPARVEPAARVEFILTPGTTIRTTPSPEASAVGRHLAELLRRPTGYPLPVVAAGQTEVPGGISLLLTGDETSSGRAGKAAAGSGSAESYRLEITASGVVVRARTAAGLFYGVQTLRQLLPPKIESARRQPGPWAIPGGVIDDHPRFGYRGAMLDVARHFFAVPHVLRFIDHLARYKLNHLHLHLTDDQGWRIAVDSWPRLASVGGSTEVDGGPGGYYTKEQYAEIVAYAAARHITVVPEIDLPGHTNAALNAYGELAPDGVAPPEYTGTDVGFSAVAVDNERTYQFVDDVLGEIAALTPGRYLHVGGDEAFTLDRADYTRFMNRVQRIVTGHGKRVLGWHQLAVAEHSPGRLIQYWGTSTEDPVVAAAVRDGAKLLLSPGNRSYLDMKYSAATPLGKDWAGLVEVRAAYDWDPGDYLAGVPADAVLGVEAPLWTETIRTVGDIEFMTFPRLPAIAELGWSPAQARDWVDFRLRLAGQGVRWSTAGITFHRSPEVPWTGAPVVPEPRSAGSTAGAAGGSADPASGSGPPPADDQPVPIA
ncbi:beta-N-acetylhexosaminidase [Plantactinospora sp. KLBMP9567]|uniref:beta-N-acetylhexosaminidase n=1 Tax=Plantactinospora sp. KLBMP9567 TaxID=3085900 RepID=UPI0029816E1F|nr:beta-N-acetylhexosaminidase [Plantactinospora sp. KLBMP9567]MDW5327425.1 beta-N-acetylhexosaminidase [Plantactinospora sp. KLBMP9567]